MFREVPFVNIIRQTWGFSLSVRILHDFFLRVLRASAWASFPHLWPLFILPTDLK